MHCAKPGNSESGTFSEENAHMHQGASDLSLASACARDVGDMLADREIASPTTPDVSASAPRGGLERQISVWDDVAPVCHLAWTAAKFSRD